MVGRVVFPKTILLFCDAKTYVTPLDRTAFACYSKRTVCLEGMFSASGTQRQTEKDGAQCYHHPVCGPCGGVDPGVYGAQKVAQPAETTPTPTAPPAEETVSATPSIELPPYGGYSFDNDELVQLSDCAFVGDSICSGLFVYDVLPKDMVVATGNVGIRSLREYTFDINGGTYTALEALKVINPKYVIFSMGMNDINMTSEETYCQNYLSFLADTQAELPSAKLYVASITPIDAGSNFASNDKIDRYNAAAKAAVEQAGYGFIDVTTHLRNDTGGLNPDCGGGDGIHVNKLGYYSMLTDVAKRLVADRH